MQEPSKEEQAKLEKYVGKIKEKLSEFSEEDLKKFLRDFWRCGVFIESTDEQFQETVTCAIDDHTTVSVLGNFEALIGYDRESGARVIMGLDPSLAWKILVIVNQQRKQRFLENQT